MRRCPPPAPGKIDPGIRKAVERLQAEGVETFESCEEGSGITHVLGDEAVESPDATAHALLVGRNDVAQVFRVESRRQCRRPNKIAEHHRNLAPLCHGAVASRVRGDPCAGEIPEAAPALCAELGAGYIAVAASWAGLAGCSTALDAKFAAFRQISAAAQAPHRVQHRSSRIVPFGPGPLRDGWCRERRWESQSPIRRAVT
jgi:hypothetical protein